MGIFTKKKENIYEDNPYQEYDNYGVNVIDLGEEKESKIKKVINIIFIMILAGMIMIVTDTIAVARYQTGPFFAIRTHVYKDGGTSVYHGLGYKVIKYNQTEGRKDMEIGTWSMTYSDAPKTISILDLAIEFRNNPKEAYKKYAGETIKVTGNISKVEEKNNKVILKYTDEDKAYTLEMITILNKESKDATNYKQKDKITILGTVANFKTKTNSTPSKLYLKNGFIQ